MSRIYVVTTPTGQMLIEADNQSQAIRHAARKIITAKPATAKEVLAHMFEHKGRGVESALNTIAEAEEGTNETDA